MAFIVLQKKKGIQQNKKQPNTIAKVLVALRSRLSFLACNPLDLQFLARVKIREEVAKLNTDFLVQSLSSLVTEPEPELSSLIRDLNRFKWEGGVASPLDVVVKIWTGVSSSSSSNVSDCLCEDEVRKETLELLLGAGKSTW